MDGQDMVTCSGFHLDLASLQRHSAFRCWKGKPPVQSIRSSSREAQGIPTESMGPKFGQIVNATCGTVVADLGLPKSVTQPDDLGRARHCLFKFKVGFRPSQELGG